KYSPRPGTPAAQRSDQVPEPVKSERLQALQAAIDDGHRAFNLSRVGTVAEVLFERRGRHAGQIVGRSPWLSPVEVDGPNALIGTIMPVRIDAVGANSFFGSLPLEGAGASSPALEATA